MAEVEFKLDEHHELAFTVDITGNTKVDSIPQIRFVCEGPDKVLYSFEGVYSKDSQVEIEIPPMKGKMPEGVYSSRLEVILEDKYFVPLELEVNFIKPTSVVAEIIQVKKKPKKVMPKPEKKVVASLVSSKSKKVESAVRLSKKKAKMPTLADKFRNK